MQQFFKAFAGAFLAAILAGSTVFGGGSELDDSTTSGVAPTSTARAPHPPNRVELAVGFADLLRIEGDVSTILLGDPGIADASPLDSGTILLNGQAAGTTNMIVLDESGNVLADLMLYVRSRQPGTVTVRRALEPQVYSCASGLCEGGGEAVGAAPAPAAATTSSSP